MVPTLLLGCLILACGDPPTPVVNDAATPDVTASPADAAVPDAWTLPPAPPPAGPRFEDFAGADACAACHAERHAVWAASVHGRAGGPPSPATVRAPFDGEPIRFSDAVVTPEKRGDVYQFVVTRGQSAPRVFRVDGVVGAGAMYGGGAQTFFHRRPDGLLVHLPFEYNVTAGRWFCQTSGPLKWAPIDGQYPLSSCDWPPAQALGFTGGEDCKNCHGSQIEVRYDERAQAFVTRLQGLHINCESCHGPAKAHAEAMASGSAEVGLPALGLLDKRRSTLVCLACHANKAQTAPGYLSGADFDDHFVIDSLWPSRQRKLSFEGRAQAFVYQQAHRYSPCYQSGSMTCVDCHDPHTLKYRDVYGRGLEGRFDDGQCAGCHPSKTADHDAHPPAAGLRCTDCHMPVTQLPEVGTALPHGRADHAITVPNGAVCMRCHHDRARRALGASAPIQVFGAPPPPPPVVTALLRGGSIDAAVSELDAAAPPVSLVAVSRLIEDALRRMRPSAPALAALERMTHSPERDIAGAALTALVILQTPPSAAVKARLADPTTRRIVSYNLAALTQFEWRDAAALTTLLAGPGRLIAASTYLFWTTLGRAYFAAGQHARAVEAFTAAVDDPHFAASPYPLGVPGTRAQLLGVLAELTAKAGGKARALKLYERALAIAPRDGVAARGRCNLLAQMRRVDEAARCLEDYLRGDPDFLPGHFIRADLLARQGRFREALDSAREGLRMTPDEPGALRLVRQLEDAAGGRR